MYYIGIVLGLVSLIPSLSFRIALKFWPVTAVAAGWGLHYLIG